MQEMTISQALRRVKKLKGQIAECRTRAEASVSFVKSKPPAFQFSEVFAEMGALQKELTELESRLSVTNAGTDIIHDGKTMTLFYAIRVLQETKGTIAWMRGLSVRAHESTIEDNLVWSGGDHKNVEIEWTCKLPEVLKADLISKLQTSFDSLNDVVERANHSTTLST